MEQIFNLHTHTFRCHHAQGDTVDYARSAVEAGLTVLGMSDHTPMSDGRWPAERMAMSDLPGYLDSIEQAAAQFPQLTLLRALECEFDPALRAFYEDEFLGRLGLRYLVGGQHYFVQGGEWMYLYGEAMTSRALGAYARMFIQAMESGLFAFMAHPDLFGYACKSWDENVQAASRDMLEAAASLGVPLEINGYGLRKPLVQTPQGERPPYPWERFWELAAAYPVQVVISSDAHRPQDVAASFEPAHQMAQRHGLTLADMSRLWS